MSAEDRLREILHSEASTVVPAGDGLARIRERVARRRRLRLLLVPAGALTTAAAVVAVIALTSTEATQKLQQDPVIPITQPTTTAPPTTKPSPTVAPTTYTGPALWPFTSSAQTEAWKADHGNRPWAGNPTQVAQHFVADFLKLTDVSALGSGATIDLRSHGVDLGRVQLVQITEGGPWTVTGVGGSALTITSPTPMQAITSPTKVTGRVVGVDENVRLLLISSGTSMQLADTSAPAGGEIPWQGTLTWSNQTWFTGGIVGITRSSKDGSLTRITVVPVKRGR